MFKFKPLQSVRNLFKRRNSGFVMMEVLVSLVIMGMSVAALMRSFTISMNAIRRNEISTQACVLAEAVLQTAEIDPPQEKKTSGNFEEEGFPKYSYTLEYEEEVIKYKNQKNSARDTDLQALNLVNLVITYTDSQGKSFNPVQVATILMPIERFTQRSKFENELFYEDVAKRRGRR